MEQCTRLYILLHISFSAIRFPRFASFFVDPGLVVSVIFSPVIIVPVSFDSVLGNVLTVSRLSITTDSVILILCSVCFNVVVSGNVYGAVVVDPALVVPVFFSPAIITVLSSASVLGNVLTVSLFSLMTDFAVLIPSSGPCVNVVVFGDVYGAVVAGGGHVNTPTFLELQIRSLTEVQNRKIMQSSVSNSKQRTKQNLAIKEL